MKRLHANDFNEVIVAEREIQKFHDNFFVLSLFRSALTDTGTVEILKQTATTTPGKQQTGLHKL